jgi:hypothetical protein
MKNFVYALIRWLTRMTWRTDQLRPVCGLSKLACLLSLCVLLIFAVPSPAQIPSGYVQTTATVPALAGGSFGAAWTNLSSSPQLGLLGCVSTFQNTVNGSIDSYGHFSTLLADTAQICPTPSTWTFTLSCPAASPGAFQIQVAITGGGGTEDISSQITAALPAGICSGGGGGTLPIMKGGTGATTAAGALANLGAYSSTNPAGYITSNGITPGYTLGFPVYGPGGPTSALVPSNITTDSTKSNLNVPGNVTAGALNGTSASFSGAVAAGSETLGSPLLPASGGTGATTAAGAWASITNGSQTGSGTSQLNTLPGTSSAVNFNFTGYSSGAIGVITANSSWYTLSSSLGYGVSTNANGGLDIMANQGGQSVRLWAGTANTAPTEVASFLNTGSVIYENLQVQGTLNNANGPVIPQTALGTEGPVNGYVLTAPTPSTGCFQYTGSAYTWGSCGGTGTMTWPTFTGLAAYGGSSNWVNPTYSMIVALFGSGSCSGYLKSDGTCSTPGGTWASITNGAQTGSGTSQLNTLPGNISPRAVGTGAAAVATGVNWTANGYDAGRANTTGVGWTATGSAAGYYSTTGSNWTATGVQTGYYSTTGSNWTATGSTAGYNNQTGSGWTATGMQAGFYNQTGSNWTANGFDAGMYIADGATPNESGNNSVYEGYERNGDRLCRNWTRQQHGDTRQFNDNRNVLFRLTEQRQRPSHSSDGSRLSGSSGGVCAECTLSHRHTGMSVRQWLRHKIMGRM